jgi:hypothetical protein
VSDAGAGFLAAALRNGARIAELRLPSNSVGPTGADALAGALAAAAAVGGPGLQVLDPP